LRVIRETPAEAVETLLRSDLDALVIGDHVLRPPSRDGSERPTLVAATA
jgi:hypothetical protein